MSSKTAARSERDNNEGAPHGDIAFPERLRAAIAHRGLGLDRIAARLAERGVSCSTSTLSLWHNGHTQPRRVESRRALEALEDILETSRGYLVDAPQPMKIGSAAWWERSAPSEEVFAYGEDFERALASMGLEHPTELHRVSFIDIASIDEQRRFVGSRCQLIVQASQDGAEQLVASTYAEGKQGITDDLRTIEPRSGVRLGRRRVLPEEGLVVSELILDSPLRRGEVAVVEYDVVPARGPEEPLPGVNSFEMRTARPIGQVVLAVDFAPGCIPTTVVVRTDPTDDHGRPLPAHIADVHLQGRRAVATGKGLYRGGLRVDWTWEESP